MHKSLRFLKGKARVEKCGESIQGFTKVDLKDESEETWSKCSVKAGCIRIRKYVKCRCSSPRCSHYRCHYPYPVSGAYGLPILSSYPLRLISATICTKCFTYEVVIQLVQKHRLTSSIEHIFASRA